MAWLTEFDKNQITQGTIVDNVPWNLNHNPLGVILTNACDIQWDKANFLHIACLLPAKDILQNSNEFEQITSSADEDNNLSKTKTKSLDKFFSDFIYNRNIVRFFYIDPKPVLESLPHFLLDFQNLITIPFKEEERLNPIAQLPSPHREKMILHFSSYVSRVAVDRVDDQTYKETMQDLSEPYDPSW